LTSPAGNVVQAAADTTTTGNWQKRGAQYQRPKRWGRFC